MKVELTVFDAVCSHEQTLSYSAKIEQVETVVNSIRNVLQKCDDGITNWWRSEVSESAGAVVS